MNIRLLLSGLYCLCVVLVHSQTNLAPEWTRILNQGQAPLGGRVIAQGIATDGSGNVFVTGYFQSVADFDPGPGTFNLYSDGNDDIFFAKYSASGNLIFAQRIGGSGNERANAIRVDNSGNVFLTGYYSSTVDFDPGPGTALLSSNANSNDVFIAKYDPSGNLSFARSMGGSGSDFAQSISTDASGNIFITGYFLSSTADFDPGAGVVNLTNAGGEDIFFAKYDNQGNYVLAQALGGAGDDRGYGIRADASGNIYIAGLFRNTADFDPGSGSSNLSSSGGSDIFFARYDASGNYVYAQRAGSTGNDEAMGLDMDASGNLYITGDFALTVDFDPGAGTSNLSSAGSQDIFFAKYDGAGNYVYARKLGGGGYDMGYALSVDGSGQVYLTGIFSNTADFDPGAGTANLSSAGNTDLFFAWYDNSGNYLFAGSAGSSSYSDYSYAITVDASGKAYIAGYFGGTADFDPGAGVVNLVAGNSNFNGCFAIYDQSGNYQFAGALGGYDNTQYNDNTQSLTTDAAGNVYVCGIFSGTVDFDPGPGSSSLNSSSGQGYFAKYDASGNLIFVLNLPVIPSKIQVDASQNIFLAGSFSGTVDFDPGAGTSNLNSSNGNVFFAKYDASGGLLFALNLGGTSASLEGFVLDGSGNIYLSGRFSGLADFDPGAGTANLTSTSTYYDIYFAKYTSTGAYGFARRIGGGTQGSAGGLAVDASGNIFVGGYFTGTYDFDPGAGTFSMSPAGGIYDGDIYFAKYNASGNFVFAKRAGGTGYDLCSALKLDGTGNVYITGYFSATVDFDPGAGTVNLTSAGNKDVFFAKYDNGGNYVYAKNVGGIQDEVSADMALDASNNLYLTGYILSGAAADFDPGTGTANLNSYGSNDMFLAKYDASGNYVYAKSVGGTLQDDATSISVDNSGHIYLGGGVRGKVDTDPGLAADYQYAVNGADIYFAKFSECSSRTLSSISVPAYAEINGVTELTDGGCRLVASLDPTGADPVTGAVNGALWIESSVPHVAGQPFVARHFEFSPVTNPGTATARVTLYCTQQEFDDFNNDPGSTLKLPTGPADAAGIANLRIGKYSGSSSNGTGMPSSYSGTAIVIDPTDADIQWNASFSRWEISFDVTGFSGFIIQTSSSNLPIILQSFSARKTGRQTLLSWTTASEKQNRGFHIERSADGQRFSSLGFVAASGNGNSSSPRDYRFTDPAPLKAINYYRLLQEDLDGKKVTSEIRTVDFSTLDGFRLYPNPAGNTVQLEWTGIGSGAADIQLSDLQGRVLKRWYLAKSTGVIQLDLSAIMPGLYQLMIRNERGESRVQRVIKN